MIKKTKELIFQYASNLRFMQFAVGVVFFVSWCMIALLGVRSDISIPVPDALFSLVPIAFLVVPIVLLVGVVQYRSFLAYFLVHSIFISLAVGGFREFFYWLPANFVETNEGNLDLLDSYNPFYSPIYYIQQSLKIICVSLVDVALLHSKVLREKYNWNASGFVKSVIVVLAFKWTVILIDLLY